MEKELAVRKKIRLEGYDYSQAGYYYITICVEDRHEILGIVGDAHPGVPHTVGDTHPGVPCVELNDTGKMVKQHIDNILLFYNAVKINKYVIMPNHIHMIIVLEHGTPGCASPTEHGTPGCASPTKSTLAKIINAFKSLTSRKFGESMWQRSYYEEIIRSESRYRQIWQYIENNPSKWAEDDYFVKK